MDQSSKEDMTPIKSSEEEETPEKISKMEVCPSDESDLSLETLKMCSCSEFVAKSMV